MGTVSQDVVEERVGALDVSAELDQVRGSLETGESFADGPGRLFVVGSGESGMETADTFEDIDGRVMTHGAELAGEDDVAIKDGANSVADGFIEIIPFDEDGEETGDRTLGEFSGALENFGQELKGAGRIAFLARRLAGGEANFSLCHGEASHRIDYEEDVFALVAEKLGDSERDEAGAEAEGGGLVASGGNHDAALATFGAKFVFKKALDLAVALADECDHGDIGAVMLAHGAKEGAFADTGAAKDTDALAFATGEHAVDDADAGDEGLGDVLTSQRAWRGRIEIVVGLRVDCRPSVHGLPKTIEDATEQLVANGNFTRFGTSEDGSTLGEATRIFKGHRENFSVSKADDLSADAAAGRELDFTEVADGGGWPFTLKKHAGDVGNAPA